MATLNVDIIISFRIWAHFRFQVKEVKIMEIWLAVRKDKEECTVIDFDTV